MPEPGLVAEPDATVGERKRREGGLAVIRGRSSGALGQFLEFDPERVVHLQRAGDLRCNVASSAASIAVRFLQTDEIGIRAAIFAQPLFYDGALKMAPGSIRG
jgi:hypothetical protein